MVTLRNILGLMDDFTRIVIVINTQEIQAFPLFALEFFKDAVLDLEVVRVNGSRIYIDGGKRND